MERTINLLDDLAQRVERYLQEHPGETCDRVVAKALESKLTQKNLAPLLALAGIVTEAPHNASDHTEDKNAFIREC